MAAYDLVLIVIVAVAAFAAGYFVGRFKTLAETVQQRPREDDFQPLPGPGRGIDNSYPDTPAPQARPRRSSKPPPAAAGLMSRGGDADN